MKSSKKNKLTLREKKEMLADADNLDRREDFRIARKLAPKRSFEEYIHWLSKVTSLFPEPSPKKFVRYKKDLL